MVVRGIYGFIRSFICIRNFRIGNLDLFWRLFIFFIWMGRDDVLVFLIIELWICIFYRIFSGLNIYGVGFYKVIFIFEYLMIWERNFDYFFFSSLDLLGEFYIRGMVIDVG